MSSYDVYDGKCGAPSTKIYTNYTTLTQNGTFCSGPPDPRIYTRISEGGAGLRPTPAAMPGWERRLSSNGRPFLHNKATGASRWEPEKKTQDGRDMINEMRAAFRAEAQADANASWSRGDVLNDSSGSGGGGANPFGDFKAGGDSSVQWDKRPLPADRKAALLALAGKIATGTAVSRRHSAKLYTDPQVTAALSTLQRRVSALQQAPRPTDTGRSVATSVASLPTVRLQKVGGAMVTVISEERLAKMNRRGERKAKQFEQYTDALRRREQAISEKSKDLAIIAGISGSDTQFLHDPDGMTYRKSRALGAAYAQATNDNFQRTSFQLSSSPSFQS
eukprot:SAG22_NODE_452_length_10341_cov_12.146065_5_plen_334_part_00